MKINYLLKSDILSSGLCQIHKDVSKTYYISYVNGLNALDHKVETCMSIDQAVIISSYYELYYPTEWKEAEKINHAYYERVKRLKNYISSMLKHKCIFLTLTFIDDVLNSTSPDTRKKYVQRFLNSLDCRYVANIDFGKQNGREHYHSVVEKELIDYSLWKYGAINGLKVRLDDSSSSERLAKYVSKLVNHAIKETTKRNSIMYSRKKYLEYPELSNVLPCSVPVGF